MKIGKKDLVQQFEVTPDLKAYALVLTTKDTEGHFNSGSSPTFKNVKVIHNGKVLGSFPAIAPSSLKLSNDGRHVAFTVVTWRKWRLPLYRIIKDDRFLSPAGHYTEEIEFSDIATPWISPDGLKVAYIISVVGKRHVMINETTIFEGSEVRLDRPWSPDGKHFTFVYRKKNRDFLVSNGTLIASGDSIRVLLSPSTYIVGEGEKERLVVGGNPCFEATSIREAVLAESGKVAVVISNPRGFFEVIVLNEKCESVSTFGSNQRWKAIKGLRISPDGKRVSFLANASSGEVQFVGPVAGAVPPCARSVLAKSMSFAPHGKSASWIAVSGEKHNLCVNGEKMGQWDRIELPLHYEKKGVALSFFAWRDKILTKETILFSPPLP